MHYRGRKSTSGFLSIGVHAPTSSLLPRPRRLQTFLLIVCFVVSTTLLLTSLSQESHNALFPSSWVDDSNSRQQGSVDKQYEFTYDWENTAEKNRLDQYGRETILPVANGRVLVTGGGGMIGKQVVKRLLKANIPTTVLDVIFFDDELKAIQDAYPKGALKYVNGDIRNPHDLATAMRGVRGVIHLAAVSRVMWCLENERDCTDINVRGTQMVLDAMPQHAWFIQASSREVYGVPDHLPMEESAPHNPANVYGKSKAEAEDVIIEHVKTAKTLKKDHNVIVVRLSNVYGSEYDHPERLIPAIVRNAVSNRPIQMVGGDQDLDMVFVEDVVDGISLAVTRLHRKTFKPGWFARHGQLETFNLGTNTSTSAMTLIRKAMWITNSSSPLRVIPADNRFPSRYVGSTHQSETVLGYKARVSIDEGLHRLTKAILGQTVSFYEKKRQEFPFHCGKVHNYDADDYVKLNGCTALLSARGDRDEWPVHATRWQGNAKANSTARVEFTVQPMYFRVEIRKTGDLTIGLKVKSYEEDRDAKRVLNWLPQEHFKGDWQDVPDYEVQGTVEPSTGYLKLLLNGKPLIEDKNKDPREFNWRINPLCCTHMTGPWPFFAEDAIASGIADSRTNEHITWDASQPATFCKIFDKGLAHTKARLAFMDSMQQPIRLNEADLPTGRAGEWKAHKNKEVCRTMCDHPTVCLDTGDCMCGHASNCAPPQRFPWSKVANLDLLSYPPAPEPEFKKSTPGEKTSLELRVERSSFANVLSPDSRRYLASKPAWPDVAWVRGTDYFEDKKVANASGWWDLKNCKFGCFSADSVMERASKSMAKVYQKGKSLLFVPFAQYNDFVVAYQKAEDSIEMARSQVPGKDLDENDIAMPMTHDFGRCNHAGLDVYSQRRDFRPQSEGFSKASVWAPMGDLYSPCYRPDQDIVIPARTCLQDQLKKAFHTVHDVKPARERPSLVFFRGGSYGLAGGAIIRSKLRCDRKIATQPHEARLVGGTDLEAWYGRGGQGMDYAQTINNTVFCPLPRGTTGWATRTIDVIYGGCIPVLFTDRTHHPWWDTLDWSKFAVFLEEWDIDRLEDILMKYSWEEIEQMQANLMLMRESLVYPSEGHMDDNANERRPWWFATHTSWLHRQTRYPV